MNIVFFFIVLCSPLLIMAEFVYHNIIQLTIAADPGLIQKDLAILDEYKKKQLQDMYLQDEGSDNLDFENAVDFNNNNFLHHFDLYREISKQLLEKHNQGIVDVCVYYRGFYRYSDTSGRVVFPRFDLRDEYTMIVTTDIEPVVLAGAIPDHFIVGYESPYAVYVARAVYFEDEKNNQKMVWRVWPEENVLQQNKIPFDAMIVFGDPSGFLFSEDEIVTQKSLNIILPPLYVVDYTKNAFSHYGQLAINTLRYWKSLDMKNAETEFEDQIHQAVILH